MELIHITKVGLDNQISDLVVSPSTTQQVKMLQEMEQKRSRNRQNNKRYLLSFTLCSRSQLD